MSDLAEFLLARIAEDEAAARTEVEITDQFFGRPGDAFEVAYLWARTTRLPSTGGSGTSFAQGCPSPTRVLAECDAKRRIVEHHKEVLIERLDDEFPGDSCDALCVVDNDDFPCETLRLLALPYADQPGYLEEWKP